MNGLPSAQPAKFFIAGAIVLCAITVAAVVLLAVLQPTNTMAIPTVIGVTSPIIMALVAAGLHNVAASINGRMTQLLESEKEKEHVKGVVEGLVVNPKTNVEPADILTLDVLDRRKPSEPKD